MTRLERGKRGRKHIIYGELRDMDGGLLISAEIGYILDRVVDQGWELQF